MMHQRSLLRRFGGWLGLLPAAAALLALFALEARPADEPGGPVELVFLYGSEKKDWINEVTKAFEAGNPTVDGRPIRVQAVPKGSGDTIEEVLAKDGMKAHLISPASGAYLELGNAMARQKGEKDLVGAKRNNLVLSPVIVAMWKPMAEALGWPGKEIGWKELHDLAANKDGWGSVGHPEWGRFKFGHTHPERSNSGLIALFAQVYAATGKKKLTVADVESPNTSAFLRDLQRAVVHYGESTGFFANQLFGNGMDYLNAAVLYENLVIESYGPKYQGKLPAEVVAIYPKEGTFWSDHPVAVVEREWVTPQHRKAAEQYIAFLLQDEQQRKALKYGFRPGVDSVEIGTPIDKAHGADPSKPGANVLRPPEVDVMKAALKAWARDKKHARVALVFDKSESMIWEKGKLENAKEGAKELVKQLGDEDSLALLVFNRKLFWVERGAKLKEEGARARLMKEIDAIDARGGTALYDAIASAHQHLQSTADPDTITAIVVLTDGQDEDSKMKLPELLGQIKVDNKNSVMRIYTIAYGAEADKKVLEQIANITKAKAYVVPPATIRGVVKDIATFF
jgi:Ca-activated chloride channel family protein